MHWWKSVSMTPFCDHELHDGFEQQCSRRRGLLKHEVPAGFELEVAHLNCKTHQLLCLFEVPWIEWTLVRNGKEGAWWRHRQHEWTIPPDHLANLMLVLSVPQVIRPVSNGVLEVLVDGSPAFQPVGLCLDTHSWSKVELTHAVLTRAFWKRNLAGPCS